MEGFSCIEPLTEQVSLAHVVHLYDVHSRQITSAKERSDRRKYETPQTSITPTIPTETASGHPGQGVLSTDQRASPMTPTIGFIVGLKAFTAAVVGGIGSIPGAMLGGLLIGVAESMITGYISSTYTNLFVFALLIVVMLVRPSGLLGRAQLQKV